MQMKAHTGSFSTIKLEEVDSSSPLMNLSTLLFVPFQPSYKASLLGALLSLSWISFPSLFSHIHKHLKDPLVFHILKQN